MQRKTLFTLCAAAVVATSALGLATARPAKPASLGSPTNWTSGDATNPERWHEDNNWSNGIPAAGDTVNIKTMSKPGNYQDPVLSTADGAAGDLTIGNGFTLTVTGVTLSLNLAVTHDIDGDLFLSNSSSKLEFKTNHATVGGDGAIVGQDNSAEIRIADDKTLTNEMIISGNMTILDAGTSGTFVNGATGTVLANGNPNTSGSAEILTIASGLTFDDADTGTPKWEATTDADAVLQFDVGASCLDGDFVISGCATLKLDGVTIKTKGNVTKTAGEIVLANSAALVKQINADCTGGTSVSAGTFGDCP